MPRPQLSVHEGGAVSEVDEAVRGLKMQQRGQLAVAQRQDSLNQSGHTSCAIGQMTDVGLGRPDGAEVPVAGELAKRVGQCLELDRIAQPRARAMSFYVRERARVDARTGPRRLQHSGLRARVWRGDAVGVPVRIGGAGQNDGVDKVAIAHRCFVRLK